MRRHRRPRSASSAWTRRCSSRSCKRFQDSLAKLGYVDGRNVIIEYRWAQGRFERLPALAAELVAMPVSVLVTAAPPAVSAAQKATSSIPIVMMVHDPVGHGFAQSYRASGQQHHRRRVPGCGVDAEAARPSEALVPKLTQLAIIWNRTGGGPEAVEPVARQLGMRTLSIEVKEAADLADAVATAKAWGAQGVLQLAAPFITYNRRVLLAALARERLPAACERQEYVVEGCLISYSANYGAMMARLASFVDRILKGAKPDELPIEQPDDFEFVINLKTAQALGLSVPPSLRLQATELVK